MTVYHNVFKVVLVSVEVVGLVLVQHVPQYATHPGGWILADGPDSCIGYGHARE